MLELKSSIREIIMINGVKFGLLSVAAVAACVALINAVSNVSVSVQAKANPKDNSASEFSPQNVAKAKQIIDSGYVTKLMSACPAVNVTEFNIKEMYRTGDSFLQLDQGNYLTLTFSDGTSSSYSNVSGQLDIGITRTIIKADCTRINTTYLNKVAKPVGTLDLFNPPKPSENFVNNFQYSIGTNPKIKYFSIKNTKSYPVYFASPTNSEVVAPGDSIIIDGEYTSVIKDVRFTPYTNDNNVL